MKTVIEQLNQNAQANRDIRSISHAIYKKFGQEEGEYDPEEVEYDIEGFADPIEYDSVIKILTAAVNELAEKWESFPCFEHFTSEDYITSLRAKFGVKPEGDSNETQP